MSQLNSVVYRQLAIPVTAFDRIKDYQRKHMARHGAHLTLAQSLAAIVREHQQNEEREAREKARTQAAILQQG